MTDRRIALDYEYLADSLEAEGKGPPIPNARPLRAGVAPTIDTRRRYFRENLYPYGRRMRIADYYIEKHALQIELVKLQNWVKSTGLKVVLLFEGRDAAGKGSTIKRLTEHLNPRGARVVALDKPTERERSQWYFQRYVQHLPAAGEIVFFDRSWYNRAGVERVMGFCTAAEYEGFLAQTPHFERMLVESGVVLFKLYFSVSREEQQRRFRLRETDPLKQWKLSPIDREAQERWHAYTEAKERLLAATEIDAAPWILVKSDDKLRARLSTMRHVLHALPYQDKDATVATAPDPMLVAAAREIYAAEPPP